MTKEEEKRRGEKWTWIELKGQEKEEREEGGEISQDYCSGGRWTKGGRRKLLFHLFLSLSERKNKSLEFQGPSTSSESDSSKVGFM